MSEWAGLGTSKKETFLKVKAPHEMKKIFKQKIFTMHNFWDTAVCLHFWMGTKLGPIMYFVNKQLTYSLKNWGLVDFSPDFGLSGLNVWNFEQNLIIYCMKKSKMTTYHIANSCKKGPFTNLLVTTVPA